jgi:lysozyme
MPINDDMRLKLDLLLKHDEGFRAYPYDDLTGKEPDVTGKLTIGYGRNLQDVPLSVDEAIYLLHNDQDRAYNFLVKLFPWFSELNDVRQIVLVCLCFNLGPAGLLKFKNTLKFIQAGKWNLAAAELLDSTAARDLPNRYRFMASLLVSGVFKHY